MMGWVVDAQHPLAVSTMSRHGLYSMTFNKLWPAAYTYDLLIDKLEGARSIQRLRMPEDVYVYQCLLDGGRIVLVAFYDDHVGQNHDEPTGRVRVELPLDGSSARVTHTITEIDRTQPRVEEGDEPSHAVATPDGGDSEVGDDTTPSKAPSTEATPGPAKKKPVSSPPAKKPSSRPKPKPKLKLF